MDDVKCDINERSVSHFTKRGISQIAVTRRLFSDEPPTELFYHTNYVLCQFCLAANLPLISDNVRPFGHIYKRLFLFKNLVKSLNSRYQYAWRHGYTVNT